MNDACDNINQPRKTTAYKHISEKKLQRLSDSSKIRKSLQTPGLESLILSITSSDNPRETLSQMRREYLSFEQFVNYLLDCIDFHPSREQRTIQPTVVHKLFESMGINLDEIDT